MPFPEASISAAGVLHSRRVSVPRVVLAIAFTLAAAVSIALLADWAELGSAVTSLWARPDQVAILLAAYTAAFWFRAAAWKQLITHKTRLMPLLTAVQAGLLANHVLPFKLGEIVRPLLAARTGVPMAEAATTTAIARLIDLAALLAIAVAVGALLSVPAATGSWIQSMVLPAGVVLAAATALLLSRSGFLRVPVPEFLRSKLEVLRTQLRQVSAGQVIRAFVFTVPSWLLESAVVLVAAQALGIELSIAAAVTVTAFTILFQVFHLTPGGIGVYEASMTGALYAHGVAAEEALAMAVLTHGLKFAYSYSVSVGFTLFGVRDLLGARCLDALRGTASDPKGASRFEIVAARLWNVINEGKPFTPVFVLGIVLILSLPHLGNGSYWPRVGMALLALAPLLVVFYKFDFPLRLRIALWVSLAAFLAVFRFIDVVAVGLVVGAYLIFTVFLWGTVYYHLRIGTRWTNFTRFWRLVLENPDPTSGNFLEQIPKALIAVLAFQMMVAAGPEPVTILAFEGFVLGLGVSALLLHQWFFRWPPAPSLTPTRLRAKAGHRRSRRFITIVIDGCRADRLIEADTPFIDRLRREGVDYIDTSTVYPARTVTGFSSMLTGAPPKVHGMSSNFVPSLNVKCDSIFESLRRSGLKGKLVGIAHLVDAFGHEDVETVTAVTDNDEIDDALVAKARHVLETENPDLLVLQLLSVDQTGHARGSYNAEYLAKIEESDRIIEEFLRWCEVKGYLEEATVLITADHGQGIGIGGHGHMSPSERYVPCIMWGNGVERSGTVEEPRSVMDVAPTIAYFLGTQPPSHSVGQVLGVAEDSSESQPVAVIVPVHNEAETLPDLLGEMPREQVGNIHVIVVDDGSTDGSGDIAKRCGADTVVVHEVNRGLGAALRSGLVAARRIDAEAAVYIDADGEYRPSQIPALLSPIESGEADYVLGSRYLGVREGQLATRFIGNKVFTALLSLAAGRWITDGQTGFRAFSRRALECAEIIHDYNYAQVLTLDLLKKGMRLREVPIDYRRRTKGRSFVGPKYLWKVPVGMVREMLAP